MSDDARSLLNRRPGRGQPRRILLVSNPSPDSSSEEGITLPEPQKPFNYPRPLPSPSRSLPSTEQHRHERFRGPVANPHIPPLTTNLHYSSSRSNPSNPTLSSPSSTSSPAVESTPPPSTPGLGPSMHGSDEGTIRPEMINPMVMDTRNDSTPQGSRPAMVNRITSRLPSQSTRRYSSSGSRPATSPTVSTSDSYMPTPPLVYRSSVMEPVRILVTTDADNLRTVDITGAMTPAFIRERIFTKLQISDEDQAKYSIYRTEIGEFAIGDALTDEELFELCRDRGDHAGNIKLLVSHTSASVHEPPYEPTSTVNTIPPPLIPRAFHEPLRPKHKNRLRQGSQSSTSEPPPAEVGYEASVSDDLDHGDGDGGRDMTYVRSTIRALPTPAPRPSSSGGMNRSHSPGHLLSPERTAAHSPESYRQESYFTNMVSGSLPGTSPQAPRFVDASHTHSDIHSPSILIPPPERERSHTGDGQPSSYPDRQYRSREQAAERERNKRRGDVRKDARYPRGPDDATGGRSRDDVWTIVPHDVPSGGYKKERPTTPQEARSNARFPISPSSLGLSNYRHAQGEPGRNRKTAKLQPVPVNWAVTWKHGPGNKTEHKPVPPPPTQIMRPGAAKSMTDMRGAFKHPPSLQPGGRTSRVPPPLPSSRPGTAGSMPGGPSIPIVSPSGDASSAQQEQGYSPDVPRSALPPSGHTRPIAISYGSSSNVSTVNSYLRSPAQDPYPRPRSALGESSSPRIAHAHQNSETTYDAISQRVPPGSAHSYSTSMSHMNMYRDPTLPTPTSSSCYPDQLSTASPARADRPDRPTRTPPRSPIGAPTSANGYPESTTMPSKYPMDAFPIDEDSGSHTVRGDERKWLEGFIDETAAEGTGTAKPRLPRALPPPTQQLPGSSPSTNEATTLSSPSSSILFDGTMQNDDGSDSDESDIWIRKPEKPRAPRPDLPHIDTGGSSSVTPNANAPIAPKVHDFGRAVPPGFPAPPDFPPPTLLRGRQNAIKQKNPQGRISKFDNTLDVTWAPRPPPEVMYDRLEEYFPEHDLDKPVIEAPSGGTSPTATEVPAAPASAHMRHKKSIRVVAAEHKRQLDRTSRGVDATVAPMSRKRHTKLWGSKLEEVTTEQGKGTPSSASDSSPGSTAKPIFRWVRGELIGKGTYGRVYLALNATTGEMIAVKQVEIPRTASDKDDSRQVSVVEALKLESETLKDLDHPHIVQYLGFEETPTFLSIFLEYVPGGSIASRLRQFGRFDEEVTKSFTGQILDGLEYLHSRGILHRDLKADNILVETSGVCKISDFGISKRTDDIEGAAAYTSMQGTVFWMAPEVVNSKDKGYNSKIDIWSVGCVVFEMWTGQRPWSGQEAMAVLLHLYSTRQAPPVPAGIELSGLADDFRLRCFAANPDERPTATELRKHSYLELQPGWTFNWFNLK